MNLRPIVLAACFAAACASAPKATKPFELKPAPEGVLTAGLVVSSGTAGAETQARALADFVKQATEKETRPAVFPDYDSLAAAVAKGQVDVAFMPPIAIVRTLAQGKLQLLLKVTRAGQSTNRSVLFVGANSQLKDLEALRKAHDLKVAWVDPSSATGYIFAKAMLIQQKIDPAGIFVKQDFLESHDAVCKAVAEGKYDVGATYSNDPPSAAAQATGCLPAGEKAKGLQVVAATANLPLEALAVREGFADDLKARLTTAAQELEKTDAGKKVLSDAFHAEGFTTVSLDDYDPVRAALQVF